MSGGSGRRAVLVDLRTRGCHGEDHDQQIRDGRQEVRGMQACPVRNHSVDDRQDRATDDREAQESRGRRRRRAGTLERGGEDHREHDRVEEPDGKRQVRGGFTVQLRHRETQQCGTEGKRGEQPRSTAVIRVNSKFSFKLNAELPSKLFLRIGQSTVLTKGKATCSNRTMTRNAL